MAASVITDDISYLDCTFITIINCIIIAGKYIGQL